MPVLLALETAMEPGGVALVDEDGFSTVELDGPRGRSLFPAMRQVLAERGLVTKDIASIAVSAGPGSYTGIRIGVTAAKTLAWSLGLPLVAVSTLEALAQEALAGVTSPDTRLVPVIDAGRGLFYSAAFGIRDGRLVRLAPEGARTKAEMEALLEHTDLVFGSGAPPHSPTARSVAEVGLRLLELGDTADPLTLSPRYLREWVSPAARKK